MKHVLSFHLPQDAVLLLGTITGLLAKEVHIQESLLIIDGYEQGG